jgi:hypothetical protein
MPQNCEINVTMVIGKLKLYLYLILILLVLFFFKFIKN